MSDTNLPVTPGAGINVDGYNLDNSNFRQSVVIGDPTSAAKTAPVDSIKGLTVTAYQVPADQCVSVTGATGTIVTATLPAVTNQFHYIVLIQVKKYFTLANTASATPLLVSTTNLSGSLTFTFGQPTGAIGATDEDIFNPSAPIKSSVSGTPTTIVAPATVGIIWRINIHYYVAP